MAHLITRKMFTYPKHASNFDKNKITVSRIITLAHEVTMNEI